ncbi:hypothetical protein MTBUT4_680002 [Magnetospirillum sp. UT-4]|nr:hypothetical protein MTBUT4_680002 [Magnetospirillum sp. UT-4]
MQDGPVPGVRPGQRLGLAQPLHGGGRGILALPRGPAVRDQPEPDRGGGDRWRRRRQGRRALDAVSARTLTPRRVLPRGRRLLRRRP